MAKLLEKNGAEMMAALAGIALPLKRFMEDPEFDKAWKEATKKGVTTGMTDVLKIYVDLAPLVFGDKHMKDTLAILSTIEGTSVKELLKMNGTDLLTDALAAYREQLLPFFTRLGLSAGVT